MENVLASITALPENKVVLVLEKLLHILEPGPQIIPVLRSMLVGLASLLDADKVAACKDILGEVVARDPFNFHNQVCSQPWLQLAKTWCLGSTVDLEEGMLVKVPVVLLRFTHDTINSRLHILNQVSIYKTFDELQRGVITSEDLAKPLDVCLHEGKLYSTSNRRLFALLMYQAVNRDRQMLALCIMRSKSWKDSKFTKAYTTVNDGLGISAQASASLQEALHQKRPLSDSGRSAHLILEEMLTGSKYEWLLQYVKLRESLHQADENSLTLTEEVRLDSGNRHPRQQQPQQCEKYPDQQHQEHQQDDRLQPQQMQCPIGPASSSEQPQAQTCQPKQAAPVQATPTAALNADILAPHPPGVQKQMISEKLYPKVQAYRPELAGKIVGMMLEMDNSDLLIILEDEQRLRAEIQEALRVLAS